MVKFSSPSISSLTLSFVNRIMGRKEGHYSLSPQHMLQSCTKTLTGTQAHINRIQARQGRLKLRTYSHFKSVSSYAVCFPSVSSRCLLGSRSVVSGTLFDCNPAVSALDLTNS